MKKDTKKILNMPTGTAAAIGAGMAALAAASYYFFGPDGKKNRTHLRGWMIKMKGEIVEKLEQAQEISEPLYRSIVDTAAAHYKKANKDNVAEIVAFAEMLKGQWKGIAQLFVPIKKSSAKVPQKKKAPAPKRPAKKAAAKKSAKKR